MIYGKEEFIKIFNENIKRDGAGKLLAFLLASDFFDAPASTRYHSAFEGGLCSHSVNVYKRLLFNVQNEFGEEWEKYYSHETIAICSLLHDLCKIDYYKKDFRNVKENGQWVKKQCFVREESLPYGHGEKSVYIVSSFIKLTREEAIAINWHMGGFDSRVKGGDGSISEAYDKFPLAIMLHVSDIEATYLDEKR
ncbi:MAG: hydrolase [Clostridia bacterium]|nr:hydrolase [Clostridia bacterium]